MADIARSPHNQQLLDTEFLDGLNAAYLDQMLALYMDDPNSVDPSWQTYFASLDEDPSIARKNADGPDWQRDDWPVEPNGELTRALTYDWGESETVQAPAKLETRMAKSGASEQEIHRATKDSLRALMLIRAYRMRGHLIGDLDPLGLRVKREHPELKPESYGFTAADMDRPIYIDGVLGMETATINQIMTVLKRTYCGTFGVQFMHVSNPQEKAWIQQRIEGPGKEISFSPEGRKAILEKLIEAESFEQLIHRRYPGTKRFGLDGGEALIPALEQIIKRGGQLGLKDINFGMPHRGRLNVLAAVMHKPYRAIFHEFQGGVSSGAEDFGSGDVKYHLGASSDREFDGNSVHLSLAPNPSHLEAVNPVVIGKARAKQQMIEGNYATTNKKAVMAVLLHGDAAFAGQGMVMECLQLSGLQGYRIGGTLHVIVNNQIGFTTSPEHSRSGNYPTDVALMVETPIFHVNGDDPESVVYAARIATEYRQKFGKDVIIDLICYRRYGHNEGDDPSFTQPIMYQAIKQKQSAREIYGQRLVENGTLTQNDYNIMVADFNQFLGSEFDVARDYENTEPDWLQGVWAGFSLPTEDDKRRGDTGVALEQLKSIGQRMTEIPENAECHRTLKRLISQRRARVESGEDIDWALAEHLAFGSLVTEGHAVRLSGQDCGRGTFSQRHSHIINQKTGAVYTPLNHLSDDQEYYQVLDSLLSEEAVLGFEYGFSLTAPKALTIWEAQFGDFANGAQVMVDQFISSAEQKWLRMSGLVMMLPHGYEGQGPEHSSARLERYLQMCAEDNMQVANCSTPANYFHILRRQMKRNFRKPLILMTPKSLLRHKLCVSKLSEMVEGTFFHRVLWDDQDKKIAGKSGKMMADKDISQVVICSGKIYFDLYEEREKLGRHDVYILRVEQLFPYPRSAISEELKRFKGARMIWCQEEPQNMGAWAFINPWIEQSLTELGAKHTRPVYIGRKAAASTATGIGSKHKQQQQAILDEVFANPK